MNAELRERQREFEAARASINDLVSGLSEETFNLRPEDHRWSIAECIDHLIAIGRLMLPRMNTAVSNGRAKGRWAEPPFRYGPLGNWFVRAIGDGQLPPRRKFSTPRLYRPPAGPDREMGVAVQEFAELQDEFVELVRKADGLDLARIKIASPVTRLLRLSLGQWLEGLSGHQRRHLWQAAQVKLDLPY
jgi:hypothetical protein